MIAKLWDNTGLIVALVLIAEGLLPFVAPRLWRSMFERLLTLRDGQIRFVGLMSLAIGLLVLVFIA